MSFLYRLSVRELDGVPDMQPRSNANQTSIGNIQEGILICKKLHYISFREADD